VSKRKDAYWMDRDLILSPLYIGLCLSEEQFNATLRRLKLDKRKWPDWVTGGFSGSTHFLEKDDGKKVCIVCIDCAPDTEYYATIGLLIHEAIHIWQEICVQINEHEPSSEFEAYSVQMIAQNLIATWDNTRKKDAKKEEPDDKIT